MKSIMFIAIFFWGSLSLLYANDISSNVLVGILEDDRAELANWKQGPSKSRIVRPLFEKDEHEWRLSTSHLEEIQWIIAFDGKKDGKIKSRPNSEINSLGTAETHIPEAEPRQRLVIGEPSKDFSGWQHTLFNRPLVLVSKDNFNDPDKWKLSQLNEAQEKILKKAFRKEFSKVINCDEDEKPLPKPWSYEERLIQFTKTYHSNKGDLLVGMILKGGKCGINEGPFLEQLFLYRNNGSIEHIALSGRNSRTLSLTFIDAGDYDSDGKSEVIFFLSGYNEDGYAMFYDSFQKSIKWTWGYH
ncbi:MAG: hypothetical protein OEV42_16780 [Deltaproteobacteria bacterium]|nr:hypothetical protein [Deltaproteobacteria bacterium]